MATPTDFIDPMMKAWETDWNWNAIKLALVTGLFLLAVVLLFTIGRLNEIGSNFPRYRCNPLFMPFAGNFGYDPKENFDFCISNIFRSKAAEVFGPVYNLLSGFTQIIGLIVDVTLGIRKLFSNFLLGVNGFISNVRDRIQGLLFQIRLSFMKIGNLMGRVYGTMYAVVWMGTSAMTAGFNIADNDLVQFLFEFCFDPATPVRLADGRMKAMADLVIGDTLEAVGAHTPVVTSVFRFDGSRTRMVRLRDVVVSADHYVIGPAGWTVAASHPDAVAVASLREIVCVNVSGHKFNVGNTGLIAADYDEHSEPRIVEQTQRTALRALNGREVSENTVYDYSIGIHKDAEMKMADGSFKPMRAIVLGDRVHNGGAVLGVVQEKAEQAVNIDGILYSAAQTVFDAGAQIWKRASAHGQAVECAPETVYSLITEHCGTLEVRGPHGSYFIRDYREVALPEMEDAYAEGFRVA